MMKQSSHRFTQSTNSKTLPDNSVPTSQIKLTKRMDKIKVELFKQSTQANNSSVFKSQQSSSRRPQTAMTVRDEYSENQRVSLNSSLSKTKKQRSASSMSKRENPSLAGLFVANN